MIDRAAPAAAGRRSLPTLMLLTAVGISLVVLLLSGLPPWPAVFAALACVGLLAKLGLAARYRPVAAATAERPSSCAVIVPVYNEDPAVFAACLRSLLAQTQRPAAVVVVDDGSTERDCVELARALAADDPVLTVLDHSVNRGKRHALATGVAAVTADVCVTVDSDTVLQRDALERGLDAFTSADVWAVTGDVRALNAQHNLLTRLVDIQYGQSFFFQRAAYSTVGTVLCCCGSLAFYRRSMLLEVLDDFVAQRFLGVPVQYGDDRRLTNYALVRGQVRFASAAIAHTMVPQQVSHFARQQLRWVRSFIRESLWLLAHRPALRRAWWLAAAELLLWGPLYALLTAAIVIASVTRPQIMLPAYLTVFLLVSTARCVRAMAARIFRPLPGGMPGLVRRRGDDGAPSPRLAVVCVSDAVLFGVVHMLAAPVLFVAGVATLRQRSWGTRAQVEVRWSAGWSAPADAPTLASDPPTRLLVPAVLNPSEKVVFDAV